MKMRGLCLTLRQQIRPFIKKQYSFINLFRSPHRFSTFKDTMELSQRYDVSKGKQDNRQQAGLEKIRKDGNKEISFSQNLRIRCEGCNVLLQSRDKNKYGYITEEILTEATEQNKARLSSSYQEKIKTKDAKFLNILHEIEQESGVSIFDPKSSELQNLNNLEVLNRLQDKIDEMEKQQQSSRRYKKNRTEILCFRCFSLKHHNRLPQQYDQDEGFTKDSNKFILNKVFNRHKGNNIEFFFMVDALDILGTFPSWLFQSLLQERPDARVSIIVNKMDIINKKYLNQAEIHLSVKNRMKEYLKDSHLEGKERDIRVFFISCNSSEGMKKMKEYLKDRSENIQLIGFPNTGKTTLLNLLARISKSTSRIPGTTVKVTEHHYQIGKKKKIYDMPGLHSDCLLYNQVKKISARAMLTWYKRISPAIMTHSAFIYGGKVEIADVRIIIFGNGGACSSDNRWFLANHAEFWKGLPDFSSLKITKHEIDLKFLDGRSDDLEIAGYGFIGFRLCVPGIRDTTRKLTLYLPQRVQFSFRKSALSKDDKVFHNKSSFTKKYGLQRLSSETGQKLKTKKKEKLSFH